jgi:hypothetical protein
MAVRAVRAIAVRRMSCEWCGTVRGRWRCGCEVQRVRRLGMDSGRLEEVNSTVLWDTSMSALLPSGGNGGACSALRDLRHDGAGDGGERWFLPLSSGSARCGWSVGGDGAWFG